MSELQKYYRYEFNVLNPSKPFLRTFLRIRDTPKGFVVIPESLLPTWERYSGRKIYKPYKRKLERRVLHSSVNKYCYPNIDDAFKGFVKRQEHRWGILSDQLEMIEEFLKSVNEGECNV